MPTVRGAMPLPWLQAERTARRERLRIVRSGPTVAPEQLQRQRLRQTQRKRAVRRIIRMRLAREITAADTKAAAAMVGRNSHPLRDKAQCGRRPGSRAAPLVLEMEAWAGRTTVCPEAAASRLARSSPTVR